MMQISHRNYIVVVKKVFLQRSSSFCRQSLYNTGFLNNICPGKVPGQILWF
jgi:hypothetical protein